MNTKTAVVMFAVLAALGLAAATLVVPIVPQAHADPQCTFGIPPPKGGTCRDFGQSHNPNTHGPP